MLKGDKLLTIGICRKFKAVHMISCLVRCNGREIRRGVLNKHKGLSRGQFLQERPAVKMLVTWNSAIVLIATSTVNGKCVNLTSWVNYSAPHFATPDGMPPRTKLASTKTDRKRTQQIQRDQLNSWEMSRLDIRMCRQVC